MKVPFNTSYKPGAEGLRLRHQPDLDHARRGPRSSTSPTATTPPRRRVIALKGSPAGGRATSSPTSKDYKLGAQTGTTSLTAIRDVIQPDAEPAGLRGHQRRQAGAAERPGRRDPRRPADRVLHHRGRDPAGHDRRAVPARDRPAGGVRHALREGQRARALRQRGAGGARARTARSTSIEQKWLSDVVERARAASERAVPRGPRPRGSRAPRELERAAAARRLRLRSTADRDRGGGRRLRACSASSSCRRPGWPRGQGDVLQRLTTRRRPPRRSAQGFWLNVQAVPDRRAVHPGARRSRSRWPAARGRRWLVPVRVVAVVYTDLFRGIPTILLVLLLGFGMPALQLQGVPEQPLLLGRRRAGRCPTAPTSPRCSAPASSRSTPRRWPARRRSG